MLRQKLFYMRIAVGLLVPGSLVELGIGPGWAAPWQDWTDSTFFQTELSVRWSAPSGREYRLGPSFQNQAERLQALDEKLDRLEAAFEHVFGLQQERRETPLRMAIVSTPTDYEVLMDEVTGYGSNNGGVFLLENGVPTLYSYDRTSEDSLYTLDELVSHEFTHSLQTRYFGESTPHWWTEAMAELLPGLGEDGELHIRESLLLQVAEDPHRLTVREILDSGPDEDFAEYRYGALLLKYLLDERPLVFAELSRQVQAGARRFPQLLEPGISEGYEAFVSAQLELHRGARRPALIVAAH